MSQPSANLGGESLMQGLVHTLPSLRPSWRTRLRRWDARRRDWVLVWIGRFRGDDAAAVRRRRAAMVIGAGLLAAGGVGGWLWLRPAPQPDYALADLDDVFDFTLLTDEFNRLPVEERLRLITQLVNRLKDLKGNDSVLLAAFAAGIGGAAREQVEQNVSRLAVDVWDKYAKDYATVPREERAAYLESAFVEFMKMREALQGEVRDISDEDRVREGREEVRRDRERMRNPDRQPNGQQLGEFFGFLDGSVGARASPAQRSRGLLMMRDMARHLRGQDIVTGKPLQSPGP